MASILKVDTITGVSTAGSIAVTGEGNSTTTNLQQGLCKMWVQHNAGTAILDSNNVASLTDSGTGDYNVTYTNAMASTQYTCAGSWGNDGNGVFVADSLTTALAGTRYKTLGSSGSAGDCATANCSVHGDLA
jgi:hypothetical protein